jgi:hypothetical protein
MLRVVHRRDLVVGGWWLAIVRVESGRVETRREVNRIVHREKRVFGWVDGKQGVSQVGDFTRSKKQCTPVASEKDAAMRNDVARDKSTRFMSRASDVGAGYRRCAGWRVAMRWASRVEACEGRFGSWGLEGRDVALTLTTRTTGLVAKWRGWGTVARPIMARPASKGAPLYAGKGHYPIPSAPVRADFLVDLADVGSGMRCAHHARSASELITGGHCLT